MSAHGPPHGYARSARKSDDPAARSDSVLVLGMALALGRDSLES